MNIALFFRRKGFTTLFIMIIISSLIPIVFFCVNFIKNQNERLIIRKKILKTLCKSQVESDLCYDFLMNEFESYKNRISLDEENKKEEFIEIIKDNLRNLQKNFYNQRKIGYIQSDFEEIKFFEKKKFYLNLIQELK